MTDATLRRQLEQAARLDSDESAQHAAVDEIICIALDRLGMSESAALYRKFIDKCSYPTTGGNANV